MISLRVLLNDFSTDHGPTVNSHTTFAMTYDNYLRECHRFDYMAAFRSSHAVDDFAGS